MIDSHCHLNFDAFDADRDEIVQRAAALGVTRIIIPGVDQETSNQAIATAERYEGVYAAVGIHPNSTKDFSDDDLVWIKTLAQHEKVIAIGEIGLDYYWDHSPKEAQHNAFERQLALAAQLELPVIIHNREASDDTISILESWATTLPENLRERAGVLHSFSAPQAVAERALAIGFYLGFTGPITYKNADELRHIAARVPLDRMLVETDAPFLTPIPHRGKRNDPTYIPLIVDRIASLRQRTTEEIAQITTENTERLFQLPQYP